MGRFFRKLYETETLAFLIVCLICHNLPFVDKQKSAEIPLVFFVTGADGSHLPEVLFCFPLLSKDKLGKTLTKEKKHNKTNKHKKPHIVQHNKFRHFMRNWHIVLKQNGTFLGADVFIGL